jgi:hypothetical protein
VKAAQIKSEWLTAVAIYAYIALHFSR